jgi:hypothetical protein
MPVGVATLTHDNILGTYDASLQKRLSLKTPREQDYEASSRGSEDAEAHVLSEGASQSPLGAWVSPFRPWRPTTRCRARPRAIHGLVQDGDGGSSGAGSESQGSESYLDRANLRRDQELFHKPEFFRSYLAQELRRSGTVTRFRDGPRAHEPILMCINSIL